MSSSLHTNNIDDAYIDYLEAMPNNLYNSINKNHSIQINVLSENADHVYAIQTTPKSLLTSMTSTSYWAELPGNKDFVLSQYDLIGENAHYPENENEVLLTVDKYNRVSSTLFSALGFDIENETISIDKVIGKKYVLLNNDEFYTQAGTRTATNSMFIKEGVDINEFTKELSEMSEKKMPIGYHLQANISNIKAVKIYLTITLLMIIQRKNYTINTKMTNQVVRA